MKKRRAGRDRCCKYLLATGLFVALSVVYVLNYRVYVTFTNIRMNIVEGTRTLLELESIAQQLATKPPSKKPCKWPPEHLHGRESLNKWEFDIETLNEMYPFMSEGHYTPVNCIPDKKVAIIVPYRDREPQLRIFLNNVIPRIYRQQQEFGIYIVEQTSGTPFNRGMLANIGYKEAMKDMHYDCIVIHDLDIIPEDDRNFYTCSDNPIHMAVKVEQFRYKLPYDAFAGGVTSFTSKQYAMINGFSNQFFGWGGEDDDLYNRIKKQNLTLTRPFEEHGHCGSVSHKTASKKNNRLEVLKTAYIIHDKDGLNNLNYTLIKRAPKQLYVWVFAHIDKDLVRERVKQYIPKPTPAPKKIKSKKRKRPLFLF